MTALFNKLVICSFAFVYVLVCGSPTKGDSDATLKAIIHAWKKRQQEATTFRFEWVEHVFQPKDRLPISAKEDMRYQRKCGAIVSGSRMTTHFEGLMWMTDRFVSVRDDSAFDGTNSKSLTVPAPEGTHPLGNINSIQRNENAGNNFCIAILLTYRAFHPDMGRFEEEKMQVTDESSFVGNTKCICVEQKKETYVARCWVDPRQDYIIVRYAMVFGGFPVYQCDTEYKMENEFGWVPQSWHGFLMNTNFNPPKLRFDITAQVTSFEINGPVEGQEFQLEFPPRTMVKDWINDQRIVVLDDGTIRVATRAENERGITYEELLHSKETTWGRGLLTAASIAGLGMVLGLLLLWLRNKRRQRA